ncbi:MAG: efflux RND transporter periplasmic adaptor subunit [Pseudomonadota bacterium]
MEKQQTTSQGSGFRGAVRRGVRMLLNTALTLGVVAGAAFAIQYGASELARRADAAPTPDAAPAIPVAATPLKLETGYDVRRAFIGQVEARKATTLSFELAGRLVAVLVDEGYPVDVGQVVARQDTAILEAERTRLLASKAAAEAQLTFAEQTVARNEALLDRGFAPQSGVDEALSRRDELSNRIAEIEASLASVDIRMEKSEITAPFAGLVTARFLDGGEALSPGQPVLGLIETTGPQVRVGVPLDLTADDLAKAEIDVAGTVSTAELISLRPDVDPVTRTRTAIFAIDTNADFAFGQTARVHLSERVDAEGFWVPLTGLKEGARGQWTVLTVDAENAVRSAPVEILHAESDRVFVRAAFADGTPLIDRGPQRVTVGQEVVLKLSE